MAGAGSFKKTCGKCGNEQEFYSGQKLVFCDRCRSKIYATSADDFYYHEGFFTRWFNIWNITVVVILYLFFFGSLNPLENYYYYLGRYYEDASHYSTAYYTYRKLLRKYPRTRFKADLDKRIRRLLDSDQDKDKYTLEEELAAGTNPRHYASRPAHKPKKIVGPQDGGAFRMRKKK